MIDREMLEDMFESIAERGDWDMSQPMLWGYFFTHHEPAALRAAVPVLQGQDYEFVELYLSEKDDPADPDLWWLHVRRVEVHTVDTLFARNEVLTEFASRHGLRSYDGMDVGPPPLVQRPV